MDIVRIILSILLPPAGVGVSLQVGITLKFRDDILPSLLGEISGTGQALRIAAQR